MNKPSTPTKIALVLLLIMGITNIVLAYISINSPYERSEFAALHNFVTGLSAFLIGALSLIQITAALFLLKLKRQAYFLTIILIIILYPLMAVSDLRDAAFEISPGASISLTQEILPVVILFFLILGRKDFRKIKENLNK